MVGESYKNVFLIYRDSTVHVNDKLLIINNITIIIIVDLCNRMRLSGKGTDYVIVVF